jgi:MFS family permease
VVTELLLSSGLVSQTVATPPTSPLDDRYGRRSARQTAVRNRVTILAVVGVAALVALTALVFAWNRSGPQLRVIVGGYSVVSDDETTVTFSVTKDAGAAVCRVVAQDRTGVVVGSLDEPIPAEETQVDRTVTLRTRGRAVVGTVDSCAFVQG